MAIVPPLSDCPEIYHVLKYEWVASETVVAMKLLVEAVVPGSLPAVDSSPFWVVTVELL